MRPAVGLLLFYKEKNEENPGQCDGQSGYGVTTLDAVVESIVCMKFEEILDSLSKKCVSDATIISRSFSMYRWTNLRSSSVTQHRLDGAKIRKISRKILKKLGVVHQMPESSF